MWKIALIAIAVAVAGVLGVAATKPDSFRVERAILIKAPPATVFPLINDLHAWEDWSPWARKDPSMKTRYGGARHGLGATYAWEGNRDVGKGRMEIIDTTPPDHVALKLEFIEPFATTSTVAFVLRPAGEFTEVSWRMHGPMPFPAKVVSVFTPMDAIVGDDFESGLADLKALAER